LAREHLKHEGFETVELTESTQGHFSYRARRGKTQCQGEIDVDRGGRGERAIDDRVSCRIRDDACEPAHSGYCIRLGAWYDEGHSDENLTEAKDAQRALGFYTVACDSNHAAACNVVGLRHAEGRGTRVDADQAATMFERSCRLGHARGCFNLALCHHHGKGVATDPGKAVQLYRRACDEGVPAACYNLGVCHRDGIGTATSPEDAASLFAKACDAGYLVSCVNLGVMRAGAAGVQQDLVAAKKLFRISCNGGLEEGCEGLRRLAGLSP
jgi:hypothetical protein